MKLGSILKDPENLESSLNLHDINEIPERDKRDASIAVSRHVQTKLSKDNSVLVKAVPSIPAFSAGASADGHLRHEAKTTVDALNVRATVFIPSPDYMNEALKNKDVKEYAKGLFGKPLYIIVGTATASKLSIKEHQSKENKASDSVNFVAPGGVMEGEGQASHESKAGFDSELEVGEECDFAYRVRGFFYSKMFGLRDHGDRTEKALFGSESSKPVADADREEIPKFEWFKKADASVPGIVETH